MNNLPLVKSIPIGVLLAVLSLFLKIALQSDSSLDQLTASETGFGDAIGVLGGCDDCADSIGDAAGTIYEKTLMLSIKAAAVFNSTASCLDPWYVRTDKDYLLTDGEIPWVPGLKNPCFCVGASTNNGAFVSKDFG